MEYLNRLNSGLAHIHSGKVRETYALPASNNLLVVATDRISSHDFVLSTPIPSKGEILTAMNIFWRQYLQFARHDLIAFGSGIDAHLPEYLRGLPELQKRAVVVENLDMLKVECIVRGFLVGSGWDSYQKNGTVCGHNLPPGIKKGARLPHPLFTPTTKADVGHDEHMAHQKVLSMFGQEIQDLSLQCFTAAQELAFRQGIVIADTKFEFGWSTSTPRRQIVLADERLTPDSSRFWPLDDFQKAQGQNRLAKSLDKQFVRDYLESLNIRDRKPENEADRRWAAALILPDHIVGETMTRYKLAFEQLAGNKIEDFQKEVMGIGT